MEVCRSVCVSQISQHMYACENLNTQQVEQACLHSCIEHQPTRRSVYICRRYISRHTCTDTYASIHTYIHAYIHTHMHTDTATDIHTCGTKRCLRMHMLATTSDTTPNTPPTRGPVFTKSAKSYCRLQLYANSITEPAAALRSSPDR